MTTRFRWNDLDVLLEDGGGSAVAVSIEARRGTALLWRRELARFGGQDLMPRSTVRDVSDTAVVVVTDAEHVRGGSFFEQRHTISPTGDVETSDAPRPSSGGSPA